MAVTSERRQTVWVYYVDPDYGAAIDVYDGLPLENTVEVKDGALQIEGRDKFVTYAPGVWRKVIAREAE